MTELASRTVARNAGLSDIVALLEADHTRKLDVVVPARSLSMADGRLNVVGADPVISEDGVTSGALSLLPTYDCDTSLANRLDIPVQYLRRMRQQAPGMLDANVNGWLSHDSFRDSRFLVRAFSSGDGDSIARALLSDSYRPIDHLDVAMSVLEGLRGLNAELKFSCDLTDRRFYMRVTAPEVIAYAPAWLDSYRDPRSGALGRDNAGIAAGLLITNSETGHGSASIAPYLTVLVCSNGMTRTQDAVKRVHLGAKLPEGIIKWSNETTDKTLDLLRSSMQDAVRTFLDVKYMKKVVAEIEARAGKPVDDPEETIRTLSNRLSYSEDQRKSILSHFIKGADTTVGGVMQAVTSAAQDYVPDVRADMEADAFRALELAFAAS
jgi:hypothetical protein